MTYRLSQRKTTRSPPPLVHKVRLYLGKCFGFTLDKLPMTFTWGHRHVYISLSGFQLNVIRVELFKPPPGVSSATVPKQRIMLPLSSMARQIHYLAPNEKDSRGVVLIGSFGTYVGEHVHLRSYSARSSRYGIGDAARQQGLETISYRCPPVGFYIEEKDFGGWVQSDSERKIERGRKFRDGRLVRSVRYVDYQEDFDLESICSACGVRSVFVRVRKT
jgi:hypothetical protein